MNDEYVLEIRPTPDGVEIVMQHKPPLGEAVEIGIVVDQRTAREISARIAAAAGDAFYRTSPRAPQRL